MVEDELRESHKLNATDGGKVGVIALLEAATETARNLPEYKRYDVRIEITENTHESDGGA